MMPIYNVHLMAELKQREVEQKARDAWIHSFPKEKRHFLSFLNKKTLTPACDCNGQCEA